MKKYLRILNNSWLHMLNLEQNQSSEGREKCIYFISNSL